jgi:hypothetical protein
MLQFLGYLHQRGIGAHFSFSLCFDGVYLKVCQCGILNFLMFMRSARNLLSISKIFANINQSISVV